MEYGTVNKLFAELLEGRIMEGHALQSSKISRRIFFSWNFTISTTFAKTTMRISIIIYS